MTHRQRLVDLLIRHEGLRLFPYVDSVGKTTIGAGRNLTDNGITNHEAMLLLDHDLDEAMFDCDTFRWFRFLDPVRQRAVVDLRFNVGPSRFRGFRKMIAALEVGNFDVAVAEMLDSKWARQVGRRADELAVMVATGVDDAADA